MSLDMQLVVVRCQTRMSDRAVEFFEDYVTCALCNELTRAIVWQRSGTINCDACDGIIFDARNTGGTVVILELEEATVQ